MIRARVVRGAHAARSGDANGASMTFRGARANASARTPPRLAMA
jgi:hypothetical protein